MERVPAEAAPDEAAAVAPELAAERAEPDVPVEAAEPDDEPDMEVIIEPEAEAVIDDEPAEATALSASEKMRTCCSWGDRDK